jgi:hypothetical protein
VVNVSCPAHYYGGNQKTPGLNLEFLWLTISLCAVFTFFLGNNRVITLAHLNNNRFSRWKGYQLMLAFRFLLLQIATQSDKIFELGSVHLAHTPGFFHNFIFDHGLFLHQFFSGL